MRSGSRKLIYNRYGFRLTWELLGLIGDHQAPPTAKGFHFITLEDEQGMVNVVVRPRLYQQYRRLLHQEQVLAVEGVVERQGAVVNVVAVKVVAIDGFG